MEFTVRHVERRDAEAIRAIYNREVTEGVNTFDISPRTLDEQVAWIDEHSGSHPAVVAVDAEGTVLGFGSLSTFRPRPAYTPTVEDTVYVSPTYQGMGVGKALLERLVDLARRHGFHSMIARIVGHNAVSIAVHRACGFEMVGTEREVGRKLGRWLDVVEMQRML